MSIVERELLAQKAPDWLIVGWERELLEKGQARLIEVDLETPLEKISEPPSCYACGLPTVKAFTFHSITSKDQKLIVGTKNMPGYRCLECSAWPEPTFTGRLAHRARSFTRSLNYAKDKKYILGAYARNLPESLKNILVRNTNEIGALDYLSSQGLYEFFFKASMIFGSHGYTQEALFFRQSAEREKTEFPASQ